MMDREDNSLKYILIIGMVFVVICIILLFVFAKPNPANEKYVDMVMIDNGIYKNEVTGYYYWLVDENYVFIGTEDDFDE